MSAENNEILPEEANAVHCTAKTCTVYQQQPNNVTTSHKIKYLN